MLFDDSKLGMHKFTKFLIKRYGISKMSKDL